MSLESGHWYTRSGEPLHTQPTKRGAKNPTRPTNINDAITYKLLPSVSGINKMRAEAGLQRHIQRTLLQMAYEAPPIGAETADGWAEAILKKATEPLYRKSEFGSALHAAYSAHLTPLARFEAWTAPNPLTGEQMALKPICEAMEAKLNEVGFRHLNTELVVTHEMGYAGTCDLPGTLRDRPAVVDIKSKETKPGKPIFTPAAYRMQIAAYFQALLNLGYFPDGSAMAGGNLYVSTSEPGRIEWVPYGEDELKQAWGEFCACLTLWIGDNKGYNPAFIR